MDVGAVRKDFPVLNQGVAGKPLVYFDNACMTLKPRAVIDALVEYYTDYPACGGRSVHKLSNKVSIRSIQARERVASFLGASRPEEVVFTRNTTEAINLVSHCLPLPKGKRVLTTDHEHNSNLSPWHRARTLRGIRHEVVRSGPHNRFDLQGFEERMGKDVALVAMAHTSNLDGTTIPAKEVISIAHDHGALVLLDAAQSIPHRPVDVRALDVDLLAFSGHKALGPTGVGVLYGKEEVLATMDPFIVGGDTVERTTYEDSTFLPPPNKFEGGLQDYAGVIGTAVALQYLQRLGAQDVHDHEVRLNRALHDGIVDLPGVRILGDPDPAARGGITAFIHDRIDPHDIAMILDETSNIAVRSGMHCVHSWFLDQHINGSVRASLFAYNTDEEVALFGERLGKVIAQFG